MKSDVTKMLEEAIWERTHKQGVFCCFEVTMDWYGKERTDYVTYDTKGVWRFYEIKSTKADFYSKCKHTFLGHYNYYVMPKEVYDKVKGDIPDHIGVYCYGTSYKNAKKQPLGIDEQILKDSFIRSLSREAEKVIKSQSIKQMRKKDALIDHMTDEVKRYSSEYNSLLRRVREKYGRHWDKED